MAVAIFVAVLGVVVEDAGRVILLMSPSNTVLSAEMPSFSRADPSQSASDPPALCPKDVILGNGCLIFINEN